jgi:predicted transposase YbfD/YdcC
MPVSQSSPSPALIDHFLDLEDPRIDRRKDHPLINILFIAICAVLGGANGWRSIETFAHAKKQWFEQFLDLPEGDHPVPSDDTYRRTISRLDPEALEDAFHSWVASMARQVDGAIIALDGKTVRGSSDRDTRTLEEHGRPLGALHLVSAWASEQRLVLAQKAVDEKTNEITVLPDLLDLLEIEGCLVTIDAMGTQTDIAEAIVDRGGDYVLALKSNHKRLYDDVRTFFEEAAGRGFLGIDHDANRQVDGGHGRIEVRRCWVVEDIGWLDRRDQWPGLRSIAMIEADRSENRWDEASRKRVWTTTTQRRFYISSLSADAERMAQAVRSHWSIENRLHWVLDVSFREDASRIRKGSGPENVAVLRRIALNLVRQDDRPGSLRQKRKRAGWDDTYREEILGI